MIRTKVVLELKHKIMVFRKFAKSETEMATHTLACSRLDDNLGAVFNCNETSSSGPDLAVL
jgi:hypothetical protein